MHVYVYVFICTPHFSAHFLQQSALIDCIHHRSSGSFYFPAEELRRQLGGKGCCSLNTASPFHEMLVSGGGRAQLAAEE